jgi:hypothetical protein
VAERTIVELENDHPHKRSADEDFAKAAVVAGDEFNGHDRILFLRVIRKLLRQRNHRKILPQSRDSFFRIVKIRHAKLPHHRLARLPKCKRLKGQNQRAA